MLSSDIFCLVCFQLSHLEQLVSSQMAEALMLEMDGDSDGSITEEELVSLSFLPEVKNLLTQFILLTIAVYFQTTPSS